MIETPEMLFSVERLKQEILQPFIAIRVLEKLLGYCT